MKLRFIGAAHEVTGSCHLLEACNKHILVDSGMEQGPDLYTNQEIPVNVYDLGLIYKIDVSDSGEAALDMTLTAPNCPAADFIMEDIRQKVESVEGVNSATINLVFEPEWDIDMMSEEAKLELGFL